MFNNKCIAEQICSKIEKLQSSQLVYEVCKSIKV